MTGMSQNNRNNEAETSNGSENAHHKRKRNQKQKRSIATEYYIPAFTFFGLELVFQVENEKRGMIPRTYF